MSFDSERPFQLEELFFSITDLHGKIKVGNEVFARVSGYEADELRGAPHSIIRHPDMPRCVFKLLWDRIQAGQSIAAYVKNRAKDNSYYWVMAFVSCIPEGYLSIRFKPSAKSVATVAALYKELRDAELAIEREPGGLKQDAIECSSALLVQRLQEFGFESYDAFIESFFFADFCDRHHRLRGRHQPGSALRNGHEHTERLLQKIVNEVGQILDREEDFTSLRTRVASATDLVSALSLGVERASLNMTVRSAKCGPAGDPLSVISEWLRSGSLRVGSELQKLLAPVEKELQRVRSGLFLLTTSELQVEMIRYFMRELGQFGEAARGYSEQEAQDLMTLLSTTAEATFMQSLGELQLVGKAIRNVNLSFSNLEREVLGLGLAHVSGRVECVRMPDAGSLEVILHEVMTRIDEATEQLKTLQDTFSAMDKVMSNFATSSTEIANCYTELRRASQATTSI
ncbi:MAG: PAS domain-containing protein [Bdellovibrionales bacterium]|nr:PAS domain-containing protein [Bdellovibrionales bacterium]